jgi:hypothetical protein
LRLREMIAKPLISLGFANPRSKNPTLSAIRLRSRFARCSLGASYGEMAMSGRAEAAPSRRWTHSLRQLLRT